MIFRLSPQTSALKLHADDDFGIRRLMLKAEEIGDYRFVLLYACCQK